MIDNNIIIGSNDKLLSRWMASAEWSATYNDTGRLTDKQIKQYLVTVAQYNLRRLSVIEYSKRLVPF